MVYINVLEEAKNCYKSGIGKKYSPADVVKVWQNVAKFIRSSLLLKRAVDIKRLGRFTVHEYAVPVSQTYSIWTHKPVFYLDKTLCNSYGIKCTRLYSSDKISVVGLNLSTIALSSEINRHDVEDIVNETIQTFWSLCLEHKDIELDLNPLGVLRIVNRVVDMRYSRDLVNRVHRDIIDPVVLASHVRECNKRPVPFDTFLAPAACPDKYLRDLHAVNYG